MRTTRRTAPRGAGDDVDICWEILRSGHKIGCAKAEALLETQWPAKYDCAGHRMWSGQVYATTADFLFLPSGRIYPGI